ncbi:hypothetical protein ACTXG7_02460 [Mycolicibacterium sp. Dal123E01]|uniref:hypothetical protein n=1 Tax=Mycolicibacterium sp. Dal123E01 TaxID=3457578 RepID=UPI00403ED461
MRKQEPGGEVDETASPVSFGDPFGPYPEQPYPGFGDDLDPPTDPNLPVVGADEGFDPFAANAFWFPERPWYRKKQATLAMGAIGVAVVAILVAAVLLASVDDDDSGHTKDTPSAVTTPPTTTALTSSQPPEPPPPPPPPPPETPPEQPQSTWYPQYPQRSDGDRPNVTTPQTRPPQISVRPTHRPAFPNQPGSG